MKPLRLLATSSTKSSKWSVLMVERDDSALSLLKCLSGFTHYVIFPTFQTFVLKYDRHDKTRGALSARQWLKEVM